MSDGGALDRVEPLWLLTVEGGDEVSRPQVYGIRVGRRKSSRVWRPRPGLANMTMISSAASATVDAEVA